MWQAVVHYSKKYSLQRVGQEHCDASCPYIGFQDIKRQNFRTKDFQKFIDVQIRCAGTIEQNQLEQAISENDSLILEGTRFPILRFSGDSKVTNGEDSRQLVNYYKKSFCGAKYHFSGKQV